MTGRYGFIRANEIRVHKFYRSALFNSALKGRII